MASQLPLSVQLHSTHIPAVLDLEGIVPYDILLHIRRGGSDLTRPMKILTNESLFDLPYAFSKGLLKVIDLSNGEQVDLTFVGTSPEPKSNTDPRIITLPSRSPHLCRFHQMLCIVQRRLPPLCVLLSLTGATIQSLFDLPDIIIL